MSTTGARPSVPVVFPSGGTRRGGLARRLVLVALTAALAGCRGEAAIEEKQVVRPVKVATVAVAPQGRALTYSGVVRPRI